MASTASSSSAFSSTSSSAAVLPEDSAPLSAAVQSLQRLAAVAAERDEACTQVLQLRNDRLLQ